MSKRTAKANCLTPKQQRFVAEYLKDLNGTQAAIRTGYSKRTANEQAARLLANVSIRAAIDAGQSRHLDRAELTAARVYAEVAKVCFSDLRDFISWDAGGVILKASSDLPDGAAACVAEVSEHKTDKASNVRFKLHSKTEALRLAAQMLGLLRERVEHTGKDGGPVEVVETIVRTREEARELLSRLPKSG